MRTLGCAVLVLALTCAAANAVEITDPADGALQMKLTFQADKSATLTFLDPLLTGLPLHVDGYEIDSAYPGDPGATPPIPAGLLDPTGWYSIQDAVIADTAGVIAALGSTALSMGEISAQPHVLSEGSISGYAAFQPNAPWGIGKPSTAPDVNDLTFWYSKPGEVNKMFLGVIEVIPEPSTVALLIVGACGALWKRRRRT